MALHVIKDWSKIAAVFVGQSRNQVKNRFVLLQRTDLTLARAPQGLAGRA
jgi:hypothetical protein